MTTTAQEKMRSYRARLKAQGLRPIQIWVPDIRSPAFLAEAQRQSKLVSRRHKSEGEVLDFIEAAFDWDDAK